MVYHLNLACGTDYKAGWQNLDIVAWPGYKPPDLYWDARKDPIPFPDESAIEIYCGYTLMHVGPRYHQRLLTDIYRVLAPLGRLVVGEVDMPLVFHRWLKTPSDGQVAQLIWGEQGMQYDVEWGPKLEDFDKHCWGWSEQTLSDLLEKAGFRDVHRINIHVAAVWYELTLECWKIPGRG